MANIPGSPFSYLPSADPPYPVTMGNSDGRIETDNCGIKFEVIGNKYVAAVAMLEYVLKDVRNVTNQNFSHREGAIKFIFKNKVLVDIEPDYKDVIPHCDWTPEKRPQVLETIELMKKALKMKVFL